MCRSQDLVYLYGGAEHHYGFVGFGTAGVDLCGFEDPEED